MLCDKNIPTCEGKNIFGGNGRVHEANFQFSVFIFGISSEGTWWGESWYKLADLKSFGENFLLLLDTSCSAQQTQKIIILI